MADPRFVGHAIRRRMGAESSHLGMARPRQMSLLEEDPRPTTDERETGLRALREIRASNFGAGPSPAHLRKNTPVDAMSDDTMRDHLFYDHGLSASLYRDRGSDERNHARDHLPGWVSGTTGQPVPRDHTH